ncbi:MAG: hypothetical protein HY963_03970 [Ignavibacteriales bacterium]|nr:hypothetical protein [Ignavibacteriales bacterium]
MKLYYCVTCQKKHYEFQHVYYLHLRDQSKEGIIYDYKNTALIKVADKERAREYFNFLKTKKINFCLRPYGKFFGFFFNS